MLRCRPRVGSDSSRPTPSTPILICPSPQSAAEGHFFCPSFPLPALMRRCRPRAGSDSSLPISSPLSHGPKSANPHAAMPSPCRERQLPPNPAPALMLRCRPRAGSDSSRPAPALQRLATKTKSARYKNQIYTIQISQLHDTNFSPAPPALSYSASAFASTIRRTSSCRSATVICPSPFKSANDGLKKSLGKCKI